MHRDDISALYLQLGLPSQHYQDFQTEDDFRERIGKVVANRAAARPRVAPLSERKNTIVAVVSVGDFPSREFVSGLAYQASQRPEGRGSVQVVDLVPVAATQDGRPVPSMDGVKSVLIDTSDQLVMIQAMSEVLWLEQRLDAELDGGLVFLDVSEQALHVRSQALVLADMALVLLPATLAADRVVEDIEGDLNEKGASGMVSYLLFEEPDVKGLSPQLCEDLMSMRELFVPIMLGEKARAELSGETPSGRRSLADICDHIFGRLAA